MKYKITLLFIACILLVTNVYADPFATIGMQGLSFLNPQIASTVNTALCLSNPLLCLQGKVTGYVTGKALITISQASPQAANAIVTYNRFKGYIDQGAQIIQEIKVNEKGIPESGEIKGVAKNGETAGDLLGLEKKEDAFVQNVDIRFNGEQGYNEITFSEDDGRFSVRNKQGQIFNYINIKKKDDKTNAFVKVDKDGNILEADFTLTKETQLRFPNNPEIFVPENSRVLFKDNKITVENADEFKLNMNNVGSIVKTNKNNVDIFGNTLIGNDFEVDGIKVTGLDNNLGTITIKDEGHVIGKNTIAKTLSLKITGKDEEVLLAKPNIDISKYNNYIKADSILEFKGNGFSVELQEGNQWVKIPEITNEQITDYILEGKEISDPLLKYDIFGGKVQLSNNKAIIETNVGEKVIENNGENIITYQDEIREPIIALNKNDKTSVNLETNWKNYKINFDNENNFAIALCNKEGNTGNVIRIITNALIDITGKQTTGKYCTVTLRVSEKFASIARENIKKLESYYLNLIEKHFIDEQGTGPVLEDINLKIGIEGIDLPKGAGGWYNHDNQEIVINSAILKNPERSAEILRHEHTHAYLHQKYKNDPRFIEQVRQYDENFKIGLSNLLNERSSDFIKRNIPNRYVKDADYARNINIIRQEGRYEEFSYSIQAETNKHGKLNLDRYRFIPVYREYGDIFDTIQSHSIISPVVTAPYWSGEGSIAREGVFNAYQGQNLAEYIAELPAIATYKPKLFAQAIKPNSEFYRNNRYYQQNKAKYTTLVNGKEVLIDRKYLQNLVLARKYNLISERDYNEIIELSRQEQIPCSYCKEHY